MSAGGLHALRAGRLHSDPEHPTVLRTAFDVAAYTRTAQGRIPVNPALLSSETSEPSEHLDTETRADLAFLWRLERSALSEARAVLAGWTANEARITAFLATWAYERHWFARALRDVLDADAAGPDPATQRGAAGSALERSAPRRPRPSARLSPPARPRLSARLRSVAVERLLPIAAPLLGRIVGEPMTAGQMARLAVQEASLQAAWSALLPRVPERAQEVLGEVIRRRERIIAFFALEAGARISRSRAEELSARAHLGLGWHPLRVVGVADGDEDRALPSIFRTRTDRAALSAARRSLPLTGHPHGL